MKNLIYAALIVIFSATLAVAYNTSNYTEQGGERTVVGGSLDVISSGESTSKAADL
jgi:hypothetical protein